MEQQKYNEFAVIYDGNKIIKKEPTKRGSVMITNYDAKVMNEATINTKLLYELAEEPAPKKVTKK